MPVKKVPSQQQVLVTAHKIAARKLKELSDEDRERIGYSSLFHETLSQVFKEVRRDVQENERGIIGMVRAVHREMTVNPKAFHPLERKFIGHIVAKMANMGPRGRYSMKQIETILRLYYTTFANTN